MKEDLEQLRNLIRELGLTWLDEELDEIISTGKLRTKEIIEGKNKSSRGLEQVAYTDGEQLQLVIKALQNYFVTLPKIQTETLKVLNDSLKISNLSFNEIYRSEFNIIDNNTKKLEGLLNQINA